MMMTTKLFFGFALVACMGVVTYGEQDLRKLQSAEDIPDGLCEACGFCESTSILCSPNLIKQISCHESICILLDDSGLLCTTCELCDAVEDIDDIEDVEDFECDPDQLVSLSCELCDEDNNFSPPSTDDWCFSEVSTVQVEHQLAPVSMKELQVGDRVMTATGEYQTVYAFGHHHPSKEATFLQIHHKGNRDAVPLEVTKEHLIFVEGSTNPIPAKNIQVGDVLQTLNNLNGNPVVTKITTVNRQGIYAPLTTGGSLLVDGVGASSYIDLGLENGKDHDLIHMALSPYRMLCHQGGILASNFCEASRYSESANNGMPFYVHFGLRLLRWVVNTSDDNHCVWIIKNLCLATILVLTGACQMAETVFGGAKLAPFIMMFLTLIAASQIKTFRKTIKAKSL